MQLSVAPPTQTAGPVTVKQAFTHPESHPLVLAIVLLKELGPEFLAWEPETIWDEVHSIFGTTVSDNCKQKIQAVRSIYVADGPGEHWEVFEKVAAGLVGNAPRVDVSQRPTPGRALVALDIMRNIRDEKYVESEVHKYCAAVLMDYGMVYGPGELESSNKYLKNVDATVQQQVKTLVARGTVPSGTSDAVLQVQTMKSLSVLDFSKLIKRNLAQQMSALKL